MAPDSVYGMELDQQTYQPDLDARLTAIRGRQASDAVITECRDVLDTHAITRTPECAYEIFRRATDASIERNEQAKARISWLRHCLSPETEYVFRVLARFDPEVDREKNAKAFLRDNALFSHIAIQQGPKTGPPTIRRYREAIADWFLTRYNWRDALYTYLSGKWSPLEHVVSGAVIILILAATCLLVFALISQISAVTPDSISILNHVRYFSLGALVTGFGCAVSPLRRFLSVRLLVTIMIGFLPLTIESSSWMVAVRLSPNALYTLSSLAFLASLTYCAVDCAKTTSVSVIKAMVFRAMPIVLYGLLFAIILALFLNDVVGTMLLEEHVDTAGVLSYPFWFGRVYPQTVLLFAPVALLVGIFINTFWEKDTVAAPF